MTRATISAGLLLLGLGFLAGAGYLWVANDLAHYGQGTYAITGMEGSGLEPVSTVPGDAEVIAYQELPRNAQMAFDSARRGEGHTLWSKDDRRSADTVLEYSGEYVEYQDEYYQILVLSGHRGQRYWRRGLVMFIGAGGIGLGLTGFGGRELAAHLR